MLVLMLMHLAQSISSTHLFYSQGIASLLFLDISQQHLSLVSISTNPDQISTNFVAVIKYAGALESGDCIQIGGAVERCKYFFVWPPNWYTDASNGLTFTALVDVSSANYVWSTGEYTVSCSFSLLLFCLF